MRQPLVAVSSAMSDDARAAIMDTLAGAAEVVFLGDQGPADVTGTVDRAEALISMWPDRELPPGQLGRASKLRLIQFLFAGVDGVDFASIPGGVTLASNVGAYAGPIAEHVMAMALSLAKRLPQRHAAMARGEFDQRTPSLGLDGAVCAILGFGGIGQRTAALMRPFGARVHAVNTSGRTTEAVAFAGTLADLDRVLAAADILVISLPLTRDTRGLIGRRELRLMKPEAILVNVARAGVIDQAALYEHLRENPDFSAGIDTWWHEPRAGEAFRSDFPVFDLPNIIGSPHNSGNVAGIEAVAARRAAENVRRFLRGEPPAGVVRREDYLTP